MSAQFTCMVVCLIAIFCPGSPFLLLPDSIRFHGSTVVTHNVHNVSAGNCSAPTTPITSVNHVFVHKYLDQMMADNGTTLYTTSTRGSTSLPSLRSSVALTSSLVKSIQATSTLRSRISSSHVHSSVVLTTSSTPSPTVRPSQPTTSTALPSPSFTPTVHPSPSPSGPPRTKNCTVDEVTKKKVVYNFSYVSVSLIITGIILSRFGLWLSDLCITQLQQENVPEEERGIVGAMQKSFNSMLDMSMYVFVIALPKAEEFGFMGLMSVAAVGTGGLLYTRFSYKSRGHLFHFDKLKRALMKSENPVRAGPSDSANRTPFRENLVNPEDEEEEEMLNEVLSTTNEDFGN